MEQILSLEALNTFASVPKLKMESVRSIVASLDVKDTYPHMPVDSKHQCSKRFVIEVLLLVCCPTLCTGSRPLAVFQGTSLSSGISETAGDLCGGLPG